jgi:hypothetical protein
MGVKREATTFLVKKCKKFIGGTWYNHDGIQKREILAEHQPYATLFFSFQLCNLLVERSSQGLDLLIHRYPYHFIFRNALLCCITEDLRKYDSWTPRGLESYLLTRGRILISKKLAKDELTFKQYRCSHGWSARWYAIVVALIYNLSLVNQAWRRKLMYRSMFHIDYFTCLRDAILSHIIYVHDDVSYMYYLRNIRLALQITNRESDSKFWRMN